MSDPERGFTLVELMVSLWIGAVILAVAIPNFVTALDRVNLARTTATVLENLRDQQSLAQKLLAYQEVRFAPFSNYYVLYGYGTGYGSDFQFAPQITYAEGYLHLPQPNIRYDDAGTVSESGQIAFTDTEGDVLDIVVYLQSGETRILHHMIG